MQGNTCTVKAELLLRFNFSIVKLIKLNIHTCIVNEFFLPYNTTIVKILIFRMYMFFSLSFNIESFLTLLSCPISENGRIQEQSMQVSKVVCNQRRPQ